MAVSGSPVGGSTPPPPPPPQEQANKLGFTKPISLAGPTTADLHRNAELEKVDLIHCSFSSFRIGSLEMITIRFVFFFFFYFSFWLIRVFTRAMKNLLADKRFFAV